MPNITLKRFMIFNSSEGHHESREGDKLLFHWTKEATDYKVSLSEQIDDICLCDASVNVSNRLNCDIGKFSFGDTDPLPAEIPPQETDDLIASTSFATFDEQKSNSNEQNQQKRGKSLMLTFESTLVLIVEVEPSQSIWMAVHVAPPTTTPSTESSQQSAADSLSLSSSSTPTIAATVGSNHQHIDPSCIPADAIERVINNIYARFCLLNGSFEMIAEEAEQLYRSSTTGTGDDCNNEGDDDEKRKTSIRNRMRIVCENYFNSILPDVHLYSIISNVASLYNYILYLDINPLTLMKVNSFINHLVCIDAVQIRHTIVIFNDQLLWSSLNMYDTRLLYNYLVSVLIRDALQEELSKEVDKVRRIKEELPIYLTDTSSSSADCSYLNETCIGETVRVSDSQQQQQPQQTRQLELRKLYLTVFRSSNNMTLGLILSQPNLSNLIQKCEQVLTSDSRLGVVPLASLAQSVGQNFLRTNSHLNHHQQSSTPQQQQQSQAIATGSMISNSSSSWRKQFLGGTSNFKGLIPSEQKYIFMDRLDVSISWPFSMDMHIFEHLLLGPHDNSSSEPYHPSNNKKMRLIKYLTELEPELQKIKEQCGSRVCEFFGRTLSDSWLTVTNSKYRTIYSVHNVRNSGLSEAQQSAMNLKSAFASNRRL